MHLAIIFCTPHISVEFLIPCMKTQCTMGIFIQYCTNHGHNIIAHPEQQLEVPVNDVISSRRSINGH